LGFEKKSRGVEKIRALILYISHALADDLARLMHEAVERLLKINSVKEDFPIKLDWNK